MAAISVIMFQLGKQSNRNLNNTIVVSCEENAPVEGDLLRVQYVNGKKVYLCRVD